MKSTRTLILVASLVLTESIACGATGIYQTDYTYSFEGIALDRAHRQAFVVCDNGCTVTPSLIRAPKAVTLSVRASQDRTGEKSLPGMTVPTGVHAKAEIPNTADYEKSTFPPPSQGLTPKRTSVLFPLDSFTLQSSEKANLSSFVTEAKDRKDLSVSVEGYTCDLGSQAHNDILAKKRAETVAAYLKKAGVHITRVTGAGKCCYTTEDPSRRPFNRRVEITVGTGENR